MKAEGLLIAVAIAGISIIVLKPAGILQPFYNAANKIEAIRDRNADVAKQLGVEIHDVRPGGATANTGISASITSPQNTDHAASEATPFPESSATSLSPPLSAAAATEAAAAAANANAATLKAFSELH